MNRTGLFGTALAIAVCASGGALAQSCEETPAMHAVPILGAEADGTLSALVTPSVAGNSDFYQRLENGWAFALVRAAHGWSIRLYDREPVADAVDLTALTPPLGSVPPNPRDIFGWHFRNAANTGPNQGDVNAPQHLRAFVITPGLAGTGGVRPSDGASAQMPGPDDGIGWFKVLDFGLGNLEPGQQASMNYLAFEACVSWPKSEAEQMAEADAQSLDFTVLDSGPMAACGLDLDAYRPDALFLPRRLSGDLDGNGMTDLVMPVTREADGARGLAICVNGSDLHIVGSSGPDGLRDGYVGQTEAWQMIAPDDALPLHLTCYELPAADGDVMILERIEKEAVAVFWAEGGFKAEQIYRYVEP